MLLPGGDLICKLHPEIFLCITSLSFTNYFDLYPPDPGWAFEGFDPHDLDVFQWLRESVNQPLPRGGKLFKLMYFGELSIYGAS